MEHRDRERKNIYKYYFLQSTFSYDSAEWTHKNSYNEPGGLTGFDDHETKLPSYWNTPFGKICLGMKVGNRTKFILLEREATSLHSLIADGVYRNTSLGRAAWKSLIDGSSLQLNCSEEGFNARGSLAGWSAVRIGITSNNEQGCTTPDSRIGFGGGGSPYENNTCGNAADYYPDNGRRNTEAMGYILVHWN